ncbi:MAG: PIG-L family deacetylase, partial [Burkholderiales bacterium]|nr:PIG-L family deacetylase [Burkholderiales bacterium]
RDRVFTLVVSICCGTPQATSVNGRRTAPLRRGHAGPSTRRREDIAAMHSVNADFVHLSFSDGIYRRSPLTGKLIYRNERERWIAPRIEDMAHIEELYLVLRRICLDLGSILLISPMGIGHHVDHQITAQVAVRLASYGASLLFYEDFPYVADPRIGRGDQDGPLAALERLHLRPEKHFRVPVDMEGKVQLLNHYQSQMPVLFGDDDGMRARILMRQHEGFPHEFYWRAKPVQHNLLQENHHAR